MSTALAFKSEVVLAAQLVMRHRAPRLAALLALLVVCLALLRSDGGGGSARTVLLIGGVVVAVGGSRPLAPGPALAGAYRVAAPGWLVPLGRLVGTLIVTLPVIAVGAVGLSHLAPDVPTGQLAVAVTVYCSAVASLMLAVTPVVGSSLAAVLGFSAAWVGIAPPTVIHAALQKWPAVQGPSVLVWNVMPFGWRAVRWMRDGNHADLVLLLAWSCLGLAVAAWAVSAAYRAQRPPDGAST